MLPGDAVRQETGAAPAVAALLVSLTKGSGQRVEYYWLVITWLLFVCLLAYYSYTWGTL
jgi:hypothetical protein